MENPNLHVIFQSGFDDGTTTYFNPKYTLWKLDLSRRLKDYFVFYGYKSGHIMYLRKEDLEISNRHIRDFILTSIPKESQ